MTTETYNVTSSTVSNDQEEQFVATLIENAIVRYVFPVVVIVGMYDILGVFNFQN